MWRRWLNHTRARFRRPVRRQAGIALLIVTVAVAMLTAIAAELTYSSRIEMQMAANAENELRAHYFAESAVQLGQAAVLIQQMIDRFSSQIGMAGMIRVEELVDLLLPMFSQKEAGGMLGAMLGVDPAQIKGLGIEGGSFDLKVTFEDGKLNLNCVGGLDQVTDTPQKKAVGATLLGLFSAPRYRQLFERMDAEGQYHTPLELAGAMLDWIDVDEQLFMSGGAPEDYRYDGRRDRYLARNYFVDTPQELRLVRGMDDDMWASFGSFLTTYGSCKVNLSAVTNEEWPLVEGIIRAFAAPDDPNARDERKLEALAQFVTPMLPYVSSSGSGTSETGTGTIGGGTSRTGTGTGTGTGKTGTSSSGGGGCVDQFMQLVQNPTQGVGALGQSSDGTQMQIEGVKLVPNDPATGLNLSNLIACGRKTVFRLEAMGESGAGCLDPKQGSCSRKRITAIWNSGKMAMNSTQAKQGLWVYWREE
jgi:type II secretory pathway component PulK